MGVISISFDLITPDSAGSFRTSWGEKTWGK